VTDHDRPSHGSIKLRLARASTASVLVEQLLERLEVTADARARAELLVEIAKVVRDDLGDAGQALDALIEAWRTDPTLVAVSEQIEPLARKEGRWAEIFEVTRALVATERAPKRAIAYCEAMVTWLTQEQPNPEVARHYLERIRQMDATHWQVHLFQAAVYAEQRDAKRELEALDRAVLSAKRKVDRMRIHLLMGQRYTDGRMANAAEAKKHFKAALALDPKSLDALRALEAIALKEEDRPGLADVLDKRADATADEAERVEVLLRLAELQEKEFLKPDQAARTFERVYAVDPMNAAALDGLERCYRATRAWNDLVRTLERNIALIEEPQARAERLVSLAETLESKLGDLAGAAATYERLLVLAPDDEDVLGELARLTEKAGDWQAAVKYRSRLAELAPDPVVQARMFVVAGQLLAPHDPAQARAQFERAVAADPNNAAAWNALLWDARAAGDHRRAAAYLEDRASVTEAPRARAMLFVELAEAKKAMGDEAGELAAYESAIATDPTNEPAARALVDLYAACGRWQEAAPLCDLAIYAAERDRDLERLFQHRLTGQRIAYELGHPERALSQAMAAVDLRPDSLEAKLALIASAAALRADPRVLEARDTLLLVADRLQGLDADGLAQLGDALLAIGERERAAPAYEAALAMDPEHKVALAGLASLRGASGEVIAAYSLKRQLAHSVTDENERYSLLLEIADAFLTKAGSPQLAAEVYEEARVIRPRDHQMLHRLLAAYQRLEQWDKVLSVLRAIVASDTDPVRKGKAISVMAQIAKEKLGDDARAVTLYDESLDQDPSRLDVFEKIVRILTEQKNWTALEQNYRRMLMRALGSGDRNLQHALYHQLGLIYRDRLGDTERAIQAFRAAVELKPEDELDQTILRELLTLSGRADQALAMTLERVLREPLEAGPYPALFDLLYQQGHTDRAWRAASAMKHLGLAVPDAAALYAANPPAGIDRIAGMLGQGGWRSLLHPELDPALTSIFEIVAPAAVDLLVSRLSIRERMAHPGPALKSHPRLAESIKRAAEILGVPVPRLFVGKKPGSVFAFGATRPPSLLVATDAVDALLPQLLPFLIGKYLGKLLPPLLARAVCPSLTELKALLASAVRIGQGRTDEPLAAHVKKEEAIDLSVSVQRIVAAGGAADVPRWSQLADLSASRVGLVLAGDIDLTRAALAREPQAPGDLSPREQMKDLVAFFLGDAYGAIRRDLGIAIR
jgi:tetratricopeptide (TPR) repeat protein